MDDHGNSPEPLTHAQSLDLLRGGGVARVAFSQRALPAILTVGYAVVDDAIVLELSAGSAELVAMRNAVVAFQTDQGGALDGHTWSVTCVGKARPVDDPAEAAAITASYDWPGVRPDEVAYLRMEPELLQGRLFHTLPVTPAAELSPAAAPAS